MIGSGDRFSSLSLESFAAQREVSARYARIVCLCQLCKIFPEFRLIDPPVNGDVLNFSAIRVARNRISIRFVERPGVSSSLSYFGELHPLSRPLPPTAFNGNFAHLPRVPAP